jgi:putative colanic acid biosysnthesis UDP-glucose lipid carrier transferase
VNGYRGETTRLTQMEGRVKHDLWYAENWSLWLDVRIVFLTVWTTVKGDKQAF